MVENWCTCHNFRIWKPWLWRRPHIHIMVLMQDIYVLYCYSLQPNSSVRSPQLSLWSHTYGRATQFPLVHLNSSSVQGGSVGSRPEKDTVRVNHQHKYAGKVEWKHVHVHSWECFLCSVQLLSELKKDVWKWISCLYVKIKHKHPAQCQHRLMYFHMQTC